MTRKIFKPVLAGLVINTFLFAPVQAQFTRIGGGLAFSPGVDNQTYETGNPGFIARGVYEIDDRFWAIPTLSFYVPKKRTDQAGDSRTTWFGSIDANVTYTLATEGELLFYALGGVGVTGISSVYKTDNPALENVSGILPGLNVGTGIEMIVENDINAYTQIRYVIGKPPAQYLVISVGVHYYLSGRRFKNW